MKYNFKITHKIIAVICSVVILLSAVSSLSFSIFADDNIWSGEIATGYSSGTGTDSDPYIISTPEQLALMVTTSGSATVGKYYKLTADMYLNNTNNSNWKNNNPRNWCAPEKDNFFRGNFDGNGHTVYGLYYNGAKQDAALFAGIRGTGVVIKNLVISDAELTTTGNYASAFAGQSYNTTQAVFENCYVDDNVTLKARNYVAGFVGGGTCASISFKNCASFATITTTVSSKNRYGSFVGGLVYNNGTGDARKITYNNCIGSIVYTNYAQYPTYTASYCGVDGTVDSSNKAYPMVLSLENMKGESAETNMSALDWNFWKTTEKYPELTFSKGPVVYSFEDWRGGTNDKAASGIKFVNSVFKDGSKSLVYDLVADNKSNYSIARVALLSEGENTATVVAGTAYELNFWYKVDANPNKIGKFVVYTLKPVGGANTTDNSGFRKQQILDNEILFDSATDGWVKATVKFEASLIQDDYNALAIGAIGVDGVVDTPVYIDAVTVKETEIVEEDILYSFERWNDAAGGKGSGMEISSAFAKDGNKSLVYDLVAANKSNYAIARAAGLSEGAYIATAESGYIYDLSFWYKLDAVPTKKGKFAVYTVSKRGGANTTDTQGYRRLQTLDKEIVFDNATDGWVEATVRFQADLINDDYNAIAIGVVGVDGVVDTPIYLDAVTIEKADVEICKVTAHYNDDANTVKVINAVVGAPLNIPSIERNDYYIEGWYTDSAFTTKFDPSTISAGKIDIYAKWSKMDGKVICDFEDYPYYAGNGMSIDGYSVESNIGVDNSKALKYSTKAGVTNWWNTRTAGVAIGRSRYTLKENTLYKVSLKYFVPFKPDATVNVGIWAGNKAKISDLSNALQQNVSETLIINGDTPIGQWLSYTASFTAKTYDPANTNLNALAIGFVTGEKISENAVVYVDDFEIEQVKTENQTTITAHIDGKTQVFYGVPGHMLVEPPVRKDYIFEGWYSDVALKNPVNDVKFPENGNIDLYTKWKSFKNGDSITIGFDDYKYISGSKQFYPWYSIDKTDCADGDGVSIKATMDSSCATTMRLAYKGYPVLVEDGSRYLVSFSYKNIDEVPNKWTVRVYATSPLNCGIGTTVQSSEDTVYRLTLSRAAGFGTWKRHTYNFTADLKYSGHNALAINMQTNSFSEVDKISALIDSVTIRRIAEDDIVCMTNTITGPDYVVGKKDEKIVLPNDLVADGYKFLGWFMDNNYALEVADAVFSEDTVFYAKWAKSKITQDFEEYNYQGYGIGYDMDIEYYTKALKNYDSKNVFSGNASVHRIGKFPSDKKFTLITDANDKIAIGETYKVTYYVKLTSTENTEQNIYVLPTDSYFYPGACDTDMAIPSVALSELYPGVWYKITNIVTLYSPYLAVKTPGLSDIYFDGFTIEWVTNDTVIDESERVVPLGKVPEIKDDEEDTVIDVPTDDGFSDEDQFFEDTMTEDEFTDDTEENSDDNGEDTDESAPLDENTNNNSNEKSKNDTVLILIIAILAAVLIVVAILVAIYFRKRKFKKI